MRRAASSSWVRITPSWSPCSVPIRFWPPSPRVSDRYAGAHLPPLGEPGEQRGVLVVGVRADVEHAAHDGELLQRDATAGGVRDGRLRQHARGAQDGSDESQGPHQREMIIELLFRGGICSPRGPVGRTVHETRKPAGGGSIPGRGAARYTRRHLDRRPTREDAMERHDLPQPEEPRATLRPDQDGVDPAPDDRPGRRDRAPARPCSGVRSPPSPREDAVTEAMIRAGRVGLGPRRSPTSNGMMIEGVNGLRADFEKIRASRSTTPSRRRSTSPRSRRGRPARGPARHEGRLQAGPAAPAPPRLTRRPGVRLGRDLAAAAPQHGRSRRWSSPSSTSTGCAATTRCSSASSPAPRSSPSSRPAGRPRDRRGQWRGPLHGDPVGCQGPARGARLPDHLGRGAVQGPGARRRRPP